MYTALVLDRESQARLKDTFSHVVPFGWKWAGRHMTINLGGPNQGPARDLVGCKYDAIVRTFAIDGRACAVGVEAPLPSVNAIKHVTLAFNEAAGGRPKHSKEIATWDAVAKPFVVSGVVDVVA